METKNRLEQIKGEIPKMPSNEAGRFIKQFESVVDRASNMSKIKEIRFVGVEFDYKKVKIGEEQVNKALAEGFQPQKDIVTESGLVLVMIKLDDEKCHI
tara:strand:- start:51 stop:347 length:297 start_codon:yes stop_codon:yes gene_type:complete